MTAIARTPPPFLPGHLTPGRFFTHPVLGNVKAEVTILPDDPDAQVLETLKVMRNLALEDSTSPDIRRDLGTAINEAGGLHPYLDAVPACFWFVKRRLTFTHDAKISEGLESLSPYPIVEVLIRPVDLSRGARIGDCDDYATYLASLLTAAGVPCAFAVVAADDQMPDAYSHVYCVAYPNGQRVALDASHGSMPGWEAPNRFYKRMEFLLGGWWE